MREDTFRILISKKIYKVVLYIARVTSFGCEYIH